MTRTMRRWTARLAGGVIALAGVGGVGCKHQLFTEPADSPLLRRADIPPQLETHPHTPIFPAAATVGTEPANVLDLKRQPRYLSMKEAMAIAVERGNTGGGNTQGAVSDQLPQAGNVQTDTIKAFVLDPAVAAANVERSLSKFDARWITSMSWAKQDQATLNLQQSFSNGDSAAFSTTLAKPLPTGGAAGITTSINYQKLSDPPPANTGFVALTTSYTPRVQFVFEQPLLQGFGVETNQLLPNHPGSLLINGFRSTGQGTEGILISRVRADQAREQFNVVVNQQLLNVEVAYWNLYAAYWNLSAREEGLKAAYRALDFNIPRVERGVEEPQLGPQLYQQYYTFYAQVIEARGQVLEADRALRGLLGLRSDDGTVFAPTDQPVRAPVRIDFRAAYEEGLQVKPEVLIARHELKARQLDLRGQRLARMPDLKFFSSYDVNGLGGRLAGEPGSALSNLGNNQFNSWQFGFRLDMPLGFRDANAIVRQAQINLWRAWYTLSDAERKVLEVLTAAERQAYQAYLSIKAQELVETNAKKRVELIYTRVDAGSFTGASQYLQLTSAQQDLANATAAKYRAIADYNSALARIEFAKGTIQRYNNITVTEGPLPEFVQKKAADHFRERQVGLKLREHPADPAASGNLAGFEFAPLREMNEKLPFDGAPPAPGAGSVPPPLAPPMMLPPAGQVKSYSDWNNSRDGTGTSLPSSLPTGVTPPKPSAEPPAGTFTQNGTVTLPKRPQPGTEPPSVPALPSGVPTTAPALPPIPPLPSGR
jgi:outer membrane protein TolC